MSQPVDHGSRIVEWLAGLTTGLTLRTSVNAISLQTLAAGNVTLTQSGRAKLTLKEVRIADGSLTVTADSTVELVDVVLEKDGIHNTNPDGWTAYLVSINTSSSSGA